MADDPGRTVDDRAKDLELLASGNFADVEVVCGYRTWKCHRAVLVPRSVWFEKALAGPFEEASTRRVNLDEENPACVELALKYIYGRGLDVEASISPDHFVEHSVSLWHLADFLLLGPLKSPVEKAVHHYCDKQMKRLCTFDERVRWLNNAAEIKLTPWALDLIAGLRQSYKWKIEHLKAVLMEFIWVGRTLTLGHGGASVLLRHLTDTPKFVDDFLGYYASRTWMEQAVWAAVHHRKEVTLPQAALECRRCRNAISWSRAEDSNGQLADPFALNSNNGITSGWCRDCAKLDTIPWRT